MGAAHIDTGTLGRVLYLQNVYFDTFCWPEHLSLHLLALAEHGIGLAQVDADVFPQITLHHTCHNLPFFFIVLIKYNAPLLLADFLEDHVLRILGGNAAELL